MKNSFKAWLLACPGFEALCRTLTRRHVRAVMYHRFSEQATGDPRKVDRTTLARQAAYLARHHAPWTPDQHLAAVGGEPWPGGHCPVVVTVDDGYRDFGTVAHPVFREHGLPAMLFVVTEFVDGTTWFWWDRLEYVLAETTKPNPSLDLGGAIMALDLATEQGRKRAWHQVADHGRFLDDAAKEELVDRVGRDLGVAIPDRPPAGYAALSWDEVRRLESDGALFGAHTCRHPILSRVPIERAAREIATSGDRLAEELGHPIRWFCYPQGGPADWTPAVRDAVARHYDGCYLAYQSLDDPDDPYTMPRYCVSPDMLAFRWAMCGAEYLILRLRQVLGLRTGVGAGYWADQPPAPSGHVREENP